MDSSESCEVGITDEVESGIPSALVEEAVRAALAVGDGQRASVSVLLTDDATIARLHGEFLDDPTPTDVMSFELDEESVDVVVSVECARRRALSLGHAYDAEVVLYVAHGVLHACGFDDHDADERARMREAECAVLSRLGLRVTRVDEEASENEG